MLMIGKQLTAEQRLQKATVKIMDRCAALTGVLMVGDRTVEDSVPTARTDGKNEEYGRKFVEDLNDAELRFLILHEVYHKLFKHLTTWLHLYKANPRLANMACDYVINLKIVDEFGTERMSDGTPFVTMPEGGCLDEKYRGMNAKQVYDALKQDEENGGGQGKGKAGDGDEGAGLDAHDWEGAQEMSEEETKALAREIDEAIRQGALVAGKLGSGGLRDLDELLKTKIDWREALRDFITTTCQGNDYSTWRRPNRRYVSSGHYLPSGVSEKVEELVIAIDTSGSIGRQELAQFLGEVAGICEQVQPSRVRLLYWDTKVCADEKYDTHEIANITKSTKPAGGGGTTVDCVPKYLTENQIKPQAVVVLTDGYLGGKWGTAEQWCVPVLWCIVGDNTDTPTYGACVRVKD
jgi:predicted metal-dependent peptidase